MSPQGSPCASFAAASRPPPLVARPTPTTRARVQFGEMQITMTRSDLVTRLADRFSQLTQRDTEFAVKTILEAMADALARGHRIEIRGFGSFSITRRPPRQGRNPRSGAQVMIPEKLVPHFKPGKALREEVDAYTPAAAEPTPGR